MITITVFLHNYNNNVSYTIIIIMFPTQLQLLCFEHNCNYYVSNTISITMFYTNTITMFLHKYNCNVSCKIIVTMFPTQLQLLCFLHNYNCVSCLRATAVEKGQKKVHICVCGCFLIGHCPVDHFTRSPFLFRGFKNARFRFVMLIRDDRKNVHV